MDFDYESSIPIEILKILKEKDLWNKITFEELNKRIVREYEAREIILLCAVGSLVSNCAYSSFNLLIHSESSSGKDYTTKNVLKIIPPSRLFFRTRISPTVLNYWQPYKKIGQDSWNGCILYLPDISEAVLNSDAMKLMCSDGSYITITEKGEAKDIEIKGKPIIFTTSAISSPSEEILNRFSIIHLDETEEQTKAIMNMLSKKMVEGLTMEYDENIIRALGYLKRYPVKIPFAKEIVRVFPSKRIGERRNFERFFDFIKAITCVYQFQRNFEGEFLIAEPEDYDKARDIFMNIQRGMSSIPLNKRQKDIINVLKEANELLSLAEIHKFLKNYLALQNLRTHVESLCNIKIVEKHFAMDSLGREIIKYKLSEDFLNFKPIILPTSTDLLFGDSNDSNNNNNNNNSNNSSINLHNLAI